MNTSIAADRDLSQQTVTRKLADDFVMLLGFWWWDSADFVMIGNWSITEIEIWKILWFG